MDGRDLSVEDVVDVGVVFGEVEEDLGKVSAVDFVLGNEGLPVGVACLADGREGLTGAGDEAEAVHGDCFGSHRGFHAGYFVHGCDTDGADVDILPICTQPRKPLDDGDVGAGFGEEVRGSWAGDGGAHDEDAELAVFCHGVDWEQTGLVMGQVESETRCPREGLGCNDRTGKQE